MIKGFYAAVSAMLVNANRQQLLSHNVANMDTPGFKQILSSVEEFERTQVVYSPANFNREVIMQNLGTIGLGSMNGPEMVDFTQGGFQATGNALDLAIQGDGFFHIETPEGERYTRDGRFLRDADGNLVTFEGFAVLDEGGNPIELPDGPVGIGKDGTITVGDEVVAQLGLARFENPEVDLERTEGNLYTAVAQPADGTVEVAQGYLEMSNANPTQIMAQLVEVARSYEAAQQMVSNQDELMGKTISMLGRLG